MSVRRIPAAILSVLAAFPLRAFAPAADPPAITVNLTATDHKGHRIPDLTAADLTLLDDDSPQQILSLAAAPSAAPTPLVILFDMMDLSLDARAQISQRLKASLVQIPTSRPIYLYLLAPNGRLYSLVRTRGESAQLATAASRSTRIVAVFDEALAKVPQIRTTDMKFTAERFSAIYDSLRDLNVDLAALPGRKQVFWTTYGIPSDIHFFSGWRDAAPALRELGAQFNRNQTAVYTLDPGLAMGTLNRDGLNVLSAATGGRAFGTADVAKSIEQTLADTAAGYVLQFHSTVSENKHGLYHEVRVKCNRKDVRLFTQQAYLSTPSN